MLVVLAHSERILHAAVSHINAHAAAMAVVFHKLRRWVIFSGLPPESHAAPSCICKPSICCCIPIAPGEAASGGAMNSITFGVQWDTQVINSSVEYTAPDPIDSCHKVARIFFSALPVTYNNNKE